MSKQNKTIFLYKSENDYIGQVTQLVYQFNQANKDLKSVGWVLTISAFLLGLATGLMYVILVNTDFNF